jgi:RimJ/RimL family protein N-acetyltransferase
VAARPAGLPAGPVPLDGGALRLRAYTAADQPALARAFADPLICRWNPGPDPPDTVADWAGRRNDWTPGTHASWAVAGADGSLLGSVSLHQLDPDQADAEVGYWVGPWARGRGVAAGAVRLATGYAFAVLGLHRAYLFHALENPASCAAAGRAGFRLEGRLLQSHRYPDGAYHDEHLHALLAGEAAGGSGPG